MRFVSGICRKKSFKTALKTKYCKMTVLEAKIGLNWTLYPYMGIHILAITRPFFDDFKYRHTKMIRRLNSILLIKGSNFGGQNGPVCAWPLL